MVARLSDVGISSNRLVLRLLGRAELEACLSGHSATMPEELLGSGLRYTLAELDRDPGYAPWGSRAIILRATGEVVGTIRFHQRPDPARPHPFGGHAAELGYTILARHRRRGYAGEAVNALMDWALTRHGIRRFVASIAPDNAASLALATQLRFTRIGQQVDDIDGPEDVFLRVLPQDQGSNGADPKRRP